MKKLLSLALCAAAATSFAAGDEITLGYEIGVIRVALANGQKNTIIAASFKDLATGGDISVANLVKTTNLEAGAQIIRYKADGTHEAWNLTESKTWEKAAAAITQGAEGKTTMGTGGDPATTELTVGEGLWIVRGDTPTEDAVIALYGKYETGRQSAYTAGVWNLIGNAGLKDHSFTTGTLGDEIIVVNHGPLRKYQYGNNGWFYEDTTTEVVEKGGRTWKKVKKVNKPGTPTIAPGIGFWYKPTASGKLTWAD